MSDSLKYNITSADAVAIITIQPSARQYLSADLLGEAESSSFGDTSFALKQFGVETGIVARSVSPAQHLKGVDGFSAYGWIPVNYPVVVTFAPSSPSVDFFMGWQRCCDVVRIPLLLDLYVMVPSRGKLLAYFGGALVDAALAYSWGRVLNENEYMLSFDTFNESNVARGTMPDVDGGSITTAGSFASASTNGASSLLGTVLNGANTVKNLFSSFGSLFGK